VAPRHTPVRRLDERAHVAEEQGEQQGADVSAVDIGVAHDDDLAVAGRLEIEGPPRPGADDLDDRRALGVLQHVGDRGLLDVEDLASDRQQRLVILERASLAVPRALSPSTMNSSDRSTSWVRQSASLAGRVEDSRAVLRRWVSLCWRALIRAFISETTFSSSSACMSLVVALGRGEAGVELLLDTLATTARHRRGAEDLLGLTLELRLGQPDGDDCGQPGEDVVLLDLVGADLEPAGVELQLRRNTLSRACSKPATWVPPLGVAMMLTKELTRES
jgi:hypothetical protein